ncbi:MAG TPA: RES family NAD+ phosphorylase [Acidobacteriaceae bacterium]|nr:RES family NAD+ phosphorylase [Acidobacteriaceae bacterium]
MGQLGPFSARDTFRLIPTKYSNGGSVLESLALPADVLSDLSELDAATNDRNTAERGMSLWVSRDELVAGVPEAAIINAAFCHPGPQGGRFNDSRRGAWYAGQEFETSLMEVAYHKRKFLRDTRAEDDVTSDYQAFLADFSGEFYNLEDSDRNTYLAPEPVPDCYLPGQSLAAKLLSEGVAGIVYPSVRFAGGTCVACFRPGMVYKVRRGDQYRVTVSASNASVIAATPQS